MTVTKINDGGPAFPMQEAQAIHAKAYAAVQDITDTDERDQAYTAARAAAVGGMTLRDYFAAKALTTVAAYGTDDMNTWAPEDFAAHAYAIADAMLKTRAAS